MVNQRAMKADTILLHSCGGVQSVSGRRQRDAKCIDMHANSDTDDSLRLGVLKGKAGDEMREKILGLDIFIVVRFDLKSVRVYNGLLF